MTRSPSFVLMRNAFVAIDRTFSPLFGLRFRQAFFRIGYQVKARWFPELGSHIPESGSIGSAPQHVPWLAPAIPNWVLEEMRVLGKHIDPVLYPTDKFLVECKYYSYPVIPQPGRIYSQLMQCCSVDQYSHCYAIPWLKRGGADLVSLMHIQFAAEQPGAKVLVLLTEPGDSPWLSRLPAGVDVVDVSKIVGELGHEELLTVITRMLLQLKIGVLHIINSRHVWEVVCRHGRALSMNTRIFGSIYCDDYDKYGQPVGFARDYLGQCYKHLSKVFSDNEAYPRLLQTTYGYRPDLFQILKSPAATDHKFTKRVAPFGRRVLWAGRLDRQKRPDLLLAISKAMPDVSFTVFGDSVLEDKSDVVKSLQKQSNVTMKGGFDGVESLPFDEYPVFLYTSQWDGTPTIVIAAALAAIPIVASCVGGVGDIVTEQRGFPVHDIENVAAYVAAIQLALSEPNAEQCADAARIYAETEHSENTFRRVLMSTPGYIRARQD